MGTNTRTLKDGGRDKKLVKGQGAGGMKRGHRKEVEEGPYLKKGMGTMR
jgi:hypothetical protein